MSEITDTQQLTSSQELLSGEKLKAAYVDDKEVLRNLFPQQLKAKRLFESVEVFEYPQDVIARFKEPDPPNVLFTDGDMPGMTGLELAKIIKDNYKDTIIVLISGGVEGSDLYDLDLLQKYGVDFYLSKPYQIAQLVDLVNQVKKLHQMNKINRASL